MPSKRIPKKKLACATKETKEGKQYTTCYEKKVTPARTFRVKKKVPVPEKKASVKGVAGYTPKLLNKLNKFITAATDSDKETGNEKLDRILDHEQRNPNPSYKDEKPNPKLRDKVIGKFLKLEDKFVMGLGRKTTALTTKQQESVVKTTNDLKKEYGNNIFSDNQLGYLKGAAKKK